MPEMVSGTFFVRDTSQHINIFPATGVIPLVETAFVTEKMPILPESMFNVITTISAAV